MREPWSLSMLSQKYIVSVDECLEQGHRLKESGPMIKEGETDELELERI